MKLVFKCTLAISQYIIYINEEQRIHVSAKTNWQSSVLFITILKTYILQLYFMLELLTAIS